MLSAISGGLWLVFSSFFGSCLGLIFKKISHKTNDIFLGFAAGIMLAAAFMGLLPNVFESKNPLGIILGIIGIFLGGGLISLIDRFTPHLHFHDNEWTEEGGHSNKSKILLICIAIAIHNIPEGLATGISYSNGMENGLVMTISMALQKIPEGLIVVLPLLAVGMSKGKALLYSLLIAFMMVPGLILGIIFGSFPHVLIGFFNAFTFGAIIYVIADEIIPTSHEHGFEKLSSFSVLLGIISAALVGLLV